MRGLQNESIYSLSVLKLLANDDRNLAEDKKSLFGLLSSNFESFPAYESVATCNKECVELLYSCKGSKEHYYMTFHINVIHLVMRETRY
jgi:hypothetical protein